MHDAVLSLLSPGHAMLWTHHCDLLGGESGRLPGLPQGTEEIDGATNAWLVDRSGRRMHSGFVQRTCNW
jgi:hypothetical protein